MRFIPFDDTALLILGKPMTYLFHKTETKVIPKSSTWKIPDIY